MIGLGLMGTALTERLLEHGWEVLVWNRSRDKAEPLIKQGAVWSDNPIADADRVLISLYTSDVVEAVMTQMQDALRPGQTIVDTTTGEPAQSAAMGMRLAERGVHYLHARFPGPANKRGEVRRR